MGDRVDTPTSTSSEGSPPLGSRVSASSFSRHSDEASQGADAEVSYPAAIADKNPFAVALPNELRRLCKTQDLLGPASITRLSIFNSSQKSQRRMLILDV